MRFKEIEKYLNELKREIFIFKKLTIDLRESYVTSENIPTITLKIEKENLKKNDGKSYEERFETIKSLIDELGLSDYFDVEIATMKENIDAYTATEIRDFDDALRSILNKVDMLLHVESLTKKDQEEYNYIFAIKLPKYEYFDEVADFTKQLNFIFSTVMHNNRKVKLVGFDTGSEWYRIALDSLHDFKMMAIFISAVTKYVKIKLEDKQRENEIDMDDATKRLILDNMETNQRAIKEYTVKNILSENGNIEDPELFERHQRAFERMAELMIKGTKVDIDKQITTNNSGQNETPLKLPSLENLQELLEMHRDILIEHSENESVSDE